MSAADYAYQKKWRLDRELGRPPRTIPAGQVQAHINTLREAGWSWRGIGEASGTSGSAVHQLAHRDGGRVTATLAAKILALTPDTILTRPNPDGFVPALGARRRIRALMALGWPHPEMKNRSGIHTAVTLNQAGQWITRAKYDAIAAMYDQLCMTPGPSTRTRSRALKAGYPPPLAWEDIDNPDEQPEGVGKDKYGIDLDDVAHLLRAGEHPNRVAARMGVTLNAIEMNAYRHGRRDVLRLMGIGEAVA